VIDRGGVGIAMPNPINVTSPALEQAALCRFR